MGGRVALMEPAVGPRPRRLPSSPALADVGILHACSRTRDGKLSCSHTSQDHSICVSERGGGGLVAAAWL